MKIDFSKCYRQMGKAWTKDAVHKYVQEYHRQVEAQPHLHHLGPSRPSKPGDATSTQVYAVPSWEVKKPDPEYHCCLWMSRNLRLFEGLWDDGPLQYCPSCGTIQDVLG